MSHAVAALSRNLIPLLICTALAACNGSYTAFESDVDFDKDVKTADISLENAEKITLSAYQSAFLGHYQSAAYLFLDASDLPEDVQPTGLDKQVQRDCDNINNVVGTATYTYPREAGEVHKVGDRLSVVYDNCVSGDRKYNGTLTAKYTKIKGLNKRFVNISTNECVENLKKDLSVDDANILNLNGDELQFTRISDELRVEVYLYEPSSEDADERTKVLKDKYFIPKSTNTILVHQPSSLPDDAVTSENGDQVYSVVDAVSKRQRCQSFERTLNVNFDQFSTDKLGYLYTSLNGTVTLLETQESQQRINQSFVNSNFTTLVKQGNMTEVFTMKSYSVEKALSLTKHSYAYEFDGLVSNTNVFGGVIQLGTPVNLLGSMSNDYPHTGNLEIKAKGLEQINLLPNYLKLDIQVDYNGDSSGNGFGDIDSIIYTTWEKLFTRDFQES